MSHRKSAHTIYVITEGLEPRSCKIGITMGRDAHGRAAALQCGNPRLLEVAFTFIVEDRERALKIERRVHRALRHHRVMGEWFTVSLDDAIATIRDAAVRVKQGAEGEPWPA